MRPSQYQELEKDKAFKRVYLKKTIWWKNILFVPPILLLFIGLVGIMYMSQNDNLWSWIAAPYIAIFALGTFWFIGIKKHIQDKLLNDSKMFLACAARAIGDRSGRYYFIFSKENKRHNETLINKLAQELSIDAFNKTELDGAKKEAVEISTIEKETPVYLIAIQVNKVLKANRNNISEGITPLLYASSKDVFVIRYKDLK